MALNKDSILASPQYADTVVRLMVNETITLAAAAVKNYDVAALIGTTKVAEYDLKTVSAEVLVLDSGDATSPTTGYYVPATAVAVVGVKLTGEVRIANTFEESLNLQVRITVRRKPYVAS